MAQIDSKKRLVKEIFEMWFNVPDYQRPYVWTPQNINELLSDITYAAYSQAQAEYFLGSIVFQSIDVAPNAQGVAYSANHLLDGQQRLTTLLMLMAVIRDVTTTPQLKKLCEENIFQAENVFNQTPERIRIVFEIRDEVSAFIAKFIKQPGKTLDEAELINHRDAIAKDVSVKNMINAVIEMRRYFGLPNQISVDQFATYLFNKVLLVYVSSTDLDDALRMFTILNDRGIKLRNSDILKARNLQKVPEINRDRWGKFWEDLENKFGEDFDRFMSYLRTILVKEKARLSLLKEFEDKIYKAPPGQQPFLQWGEITFSFVKEYSEIHQLLIDGSTAPHMGNRYEFDNLIRVMEEGLPSSDWVPPLLLYYKKFSWTKLLDFIIKLDNKFSADWILQETLTSRIENMNLLLKGIEGAKKAEDVLLLPALNFDIASLKTLLEGDLYGMPCAKYILMKMDFLYQQHDHPYMISSQVSIEHILPQNPTPNSQWCADFSVQDRKDWSHKLGNLVLIGRRKNSSQGNKEYAIKKTQYFKDKIDPFPYSAHVIGSHNKWELQELKANHTTNCAKLMQHYSR